MLFIIRNATEIILMYVGHFFRQLIRLNGLNNDPRYVSEPVDDAMKAINIYDVDDGLLWYGETELRGAEESRDSGS